MAIAFTPAVDLLLPGLIPSQRPDEQAAPLPRLPALERLLARSDRCEVEATTSHKWLTQRFGLPVARELPAGALSLLADGGQPRDGCWLRADPVHLRVHRDQLVLADHCVFGISQREAETFADALNRHFVHDGLIFYALRPERWYLRVPVRPEILTTPLADAVGRPIDSLLPRGAEALAWHGLFNEIQMLLHDVPLNAEREARGALPVNSLWLWGVGPLPAAIERPYELVVTDDPVARGLARVAGCETAPLGGDIWQPLACSRQGDVLLFEPVLDLMRAYADEASLSETLAQLEGGVFAPLLEELNSGRLQRLRIFTFVGASGVGFEATRLSLWRFWRNAEPLFDYAGRGP